MNIESKICDYKGNEKDICKIRFEVFVDEQNVPEELEIDGLDDEAKHVLVYSDDEPIGTGRILIDGHIGRVAVLKKYRGLGIGKSVMQELIKWAQKNNLEKLWLSSQWHAHSFYLDLGFVCEGEIYEEAGIDHIKMFRVL
ncbi:GNAT family N-acetyltransferase [Candidatus Pseudothioglobus singularis]|nr:GNAT family N-acetyltransferase [Candidatus Pseudothioglobus singularis]MDB4822509.1 GNAT family N-acetyltransferase [Candidatus Pseudothioglobus singularis]